MNVVEEGLITYGWAILVVLAAIGFLAWFGEFSPFKGVNETVDKYANETDGINTRGWLCYNKEGVDVQRQAYIVVHELCHDIVEDDKKHFCGG